MVESSKVVNHADQYVTPLEHSMPFRHEVTFPPGWIREELSIPVDEAFQAAAASSSSVAVGDVVFASGA
jgi:hypothetical protein